MLITKGSSEKASENFTIGELYSQSPDAPIAHELDDKVIEAVQYIRTYYNQEVIIDSTFRTMLHNLSLGSQESSMHRHNKAIDWKFKNEELLKLFQAEYLQEGRLYKTLRNRFNLSVGFYDTFCHFDTGNGAGVNKKSVFTDIYGTAGFWDNRTKKKTTLLKK